MLQVTALVDVAELGSRVFAQHVCLWRSWRKRTPCYCFPCYLNSDICASLELCKLYQTILFSAGSFRCNDDLCYSIFHLKLCVLAVRSGTSTNAHGLSLFKGEVTTCRHHTFYSREFFFHFAGSCLEGTVFRVASQWVLVNFPTCKY